MNVVGIGLDLCPVQRVEQALERYGERFLHRIYTAAERAYCLEKTRPAESLAARFAAKEATSKALGAPRGIGWHHVEILPANRGASAPGVRLSGVAERVAGERGVGHVLLSLTHAGGVAAAMAVAVRVE